MSGDVNTKNGISECYKALERLIAGAPVVPEHVGLPLTKVTCGIVSVEAGFDRGYLKKSRPSHQPLIAKINACRSNGAAVTGGASSNQEILLKKAVDKVEKLELALAAAIKQRDSVVAQNVHLHERVRFLERAGSKVKSIAKN